MTYITGMDQSTFKESFKVAAEQLVDAVKKVLHEGNVRRIVIIPAHPPRQVIRAVQMPQKLIPHPDRLGVDRLSIGS